AANPRTQLRRGNGDCIQAQLRERAVTQAAGIQLRQRVAAGRVVVDGGDQRAVALDAGSLREDVQVGQAQAVVGPRVLARQVNERRATLVTQEGERVGRRRLARAFSADQA